MIEIGIAVTGISTARQSRRKAKITTITMAKATKIVSKTSSTERSTNTDPSNPISTLIPSGISAFTVGIKSFTPFATSRRLDFDCRTIPSPTVCLSLKNTFVR